MKVILLLDMIDDVRTDFKTLTFSKYQRGDVKKEWMINMVKGKVEPSCYWTTELVCSGLFVDLWELILSFYAKYIHKGNPKLPIYLEMRFKTFRQLAEGVSELSLRNRTEIRTLFTEMICMLCTSNRYHSYELIQIPKDEGIPTSRLKAPTIEYNKAFRPTDPKELFISMNEFGYMLHSKNTIGACFWVEWLLHFTQKKKCVIVERDFSTKYRTDSIWLMWETIQAYAEGTLVQKIIQSTLSLFSIAFVPASKERRRFLIYYAITLCCEPIPLDVEMVTDKKLIERAYQSCSVMYDDIKIHEIK
jgi:hypothetical protein